jgi:hypothetical protein
MSIRKHFTPDFPHFVRLLTEYGFQYLDRYGKAEALIGDSNSNAIINVYHKNQKDKALLENMVLSDRQAFFDTLQRELKDHNFDRAYGVAIYQYIEKLQNIDAIISPDA